MKARIASPFLACAAVLVVWTMVPSTAYAQSNRPYRSHTHVAVVVYPSGLYVGAGIVGMRILSQYGGNELLEHGAGLSLYTGLRVNRSLALELGWNSTLHNPIPVTTGFGADTDYLALNGFTADAKVYLQGGDSNVEPYVQGGLGLYLLDSDYFGAQSVGTGFQLGGGLDFQVGRKLDLGVRGLYRGLAMGPPDENYTDTYVSALTIEGKLELAF